MIKEEEVTEIKEEVEYDLSNVDERDVFKILIATDTHLGYMEDDPIRGNDSFKSFDEVLSIAAEQQVDLILLGGDLFHYAKPSPTCLNRCISIIRKHCLGDRPVEVELVSDPDTCFSYTPAKCVNYEDPNINVQYPIFSIHGNHDDPTGKDNVSAMELLSSMGLVNYIGRQEELQRVEVNPIYLRKGQSVLSLYPLSHVRDVRLVYLFSEKKVVFTRSEDDEDFFHILMLHQNRAPNRGDKNYLNDIHIPKFMDLVLWGHEHDCYINPTYAGNESTVIIQPGSSVATSLSQGESLEKHVGILKVYKKHYHLEPIPLQTVRPFIYKQIILEDVVQNCPTNADEAAKKTMKVLQKIMEEMIQQAKNMNRAGDPLPLIRLIAKYENENMLFNTIRFGQLFIDRVANVEDMLKFEAYKQAKEALARKLRPNVKGAFSATNDEVAQSERLEDVIRAKLEDQKLQLSFFTNDETLEAVHQYVDLGHKDGPTKIMDYQIRSMLEQMNKDMPEDQDLPDYFAKMRERRQNAERPDFDSIVVKQDPDQDEVEEDPDQSFEMSIPVISSPVRGARGGRARGRGSQQSSAWVGTQSQEKKKRGRGRGRAN